MAAKMRIMKLLQELRGLADVTHRRPAPRQPGLFLIQLRSHVHGIRQPVARKVIRVDMQDNLALPDPVKITHLQLDEAGSTPVSVAQL